MAITKVYLTNMNIFDIKLVCIGMHLARLELRLCTARFFRAFPDAKVSTLEGMCDSDMDPLLYFLAIPKSKRCLIARS